MAANKKHAHANALQKRKVWLAFKVERLYLKDLPNTTRNWHGFEEHPPTHTSISDRKPSFVPRWLKLQEIHLQDSKLWSQAGRTRMHVHSHCTGSPQQDWPKQSEVIGAMKKENWILIYIFRLIGFVECTGILPMENILTSRKFSGKKFCYYLN